MTAMAAIAGAQCGPLNNATTHIIAKRGYGRSSPDDLPTVSRAWLARCLHKWSVHRLPKRKRIVPDGPARAEAGAEDHQDARSTKRRRAQVRYDCASKGTYGSFVARL